MVNEIGQIFSMLMVLVIMGLGLTLMVGGPKLAERYCVWLRNTTFSLILWTIKLPFQLIGKMIFGGKKKQKKKKRP
ncbi:MAG: hypothetical protein A3C50_01075 [Candidatus Staskawiczbacteria bacterium RIFCSPHIGHO2_02_FULL_43_16]|uniref:Uncharacterized protein n=1 Tax=Candidatus Staskawiczbacteria bacterium RIFCSPHIGHO2_01_FULL_41_41 TaxID=1802203 RepID=A0A1G2HV66_9BACT|nr:MAG: hypothetical protein A2822_04765 [Candidatus Staskawiczbacteria bacterium RIFCSPHIGHO2_01_FULL_41_41]OGZ68393.1 MAG: hypothetical protein A3C50_01075 [Candidatus Staskawiczbacteria bacterium RIFCSPHIGHO2_02_FULL_43_16]OGZ74189.1 MAG: hypothetical protein A3A12_00140 [Candidatus Staskawiczbacteria bacterium RIFCSPLOWO2_01_FULL_43_17b]